MSNATISFPTTSAVHCAAYVATATEFGRENVPPDAVSALLAALHEGNTEVSMAGEAAQVLQEALRRTQTRPSTSTVGALRDAYRATCDRAVPATGQRLRGTHGRRMA